jgi:glutamate synthase (NADPH/NADH) small chain
MRERPIGRHHRRGPRRAGGGGICCASQGYEVTVYDRYDRAGGLLTYGIPGFKLEKDVVMRRIEQLEDGGVNST